MTLTVVFPEAKLQSHPDFPSLGNWWMWFLPAGYEAIHDQWGDAGGPSSSELVYPWTGRDLTFLTQSGPLSNYCSALNNIYGAPGQGYYYDELSFPYYFLSTVPTATTNMRNSFFFTNEGWVAGATYPPCTSACFSNGVGFIFAARPRAENYQVGHADWRVVRSPSESKSERVIFPIPSGPV